MRCFSFSGSKGGVGASTCAVIAARQAADTGLRVLLVDSSRHGDVFAICGVSRPVGDVSELDAVCVVPPRVSVGSVGSVWVGRDDERGRGNWVARAAGRFDVVIGDGPAAVECVDHGAGGLSVLVVRPDYLSVKAATECHYDVSVVVDGPAGALTVRDVVSVLSSVAGVVRFDVAVARAVDAGLLLSSRAAAGVVGDLWAAVSVQAVAS